MKILLSNDDGYFAPGLQALRAGLSEYAELLTMASTEKWLQEL